MTAPHGRLFFLLILAHRTVGRPPLIPIQYLINGWINIYQILREKKRASKWSWQHVTVVRARLCISIEMNRERVVGAGTRKKAQTDLFGINRISKYGIIYHVAFELISYIKIQWSFYASTSTIFVLFHLIKTLRLTFSIEAQWKLHNKTPIENPIHLEFMRSYDFLRNQLISTRKTTSAKRSQTADFATKQSVHAKPKMRHDRMRNGGSQNEWEFESWKTNLWVDSRRQFQSITNALVGSSIIPSRNIHWCAERAWSLPPLLFHLSRPPHLLDPPNALHVSFLKLYNKEEDVFNLSFELGNFTSL